MEPSGLKPDGNSLAEFPVIDTIGENAQTNPAYLTDGQCLRAKLLDDADLKCERIGPLSERDMLRPDTKHDIFVGRSILLRKGNPQRAAFKYAVRSSPLDQIHFR